jgi:hypothetical protein
MDKKLKQSLDYLPFLGLVLYSAVSLGTIYHDGIVIPVRAYLGILLLLLTSIVFIKRHHIGILLTGLTCLLGMFSWLFLSPAVTTLFLGSLEMPFGDPWFFAFFTIHVIISFRFYIGIATKGYWKNLLNRKLLSNER